jgi:F420-non-reducing hydrogenase small subunit
MPVKVAFMQLSDCWGCHQSLLNAHLGLLDILPELEIVYWPAVVDFKLDSLKARPDGDVLVGFIEGSIRTNEDYHNVELMRKKCQLIISFGTCACYGNVHGLGNEWKKNELVQRKFVEAESIADENPSEPTEHVPGFRDYLVVVDDVIDVNAYISGCPPKPEQIVSAVQFLLGQKDFPMEDTPFCEQCPLNENGCILDAGTLCFGPITSVGCSLKCPGDGNPCVGCFGPSKTAHKRAEKLIEKTSDITSISSGEKKALYEFLSLYLNVPLMAGFDLSADILKQIKEKGEAQTPLTSLNEKAQAVATNILKYLKNNPDFHEISNVCDTCPRVIGSNSSMTKVKRDYEGLPNQEECFIEQGYICMGPVTNAGCGGMCIKVNAPCTGCYGQTEWVADQASRFADAAIKGFNVELSKDELLSQVKDHIGTFQKFTLAKNKEFTKKVHE